MTNPQATTERMDEAALLDLATRSFVALGVDAAQARQTARILATADMMGLHTHGLLRVVSYGERLQLGGIDAQARPEVTTLAPALRRVEGRNALGPVVGMTALEAAMEAARESGIAAVFCNGSNHFGPIAPYAMMAAEQGFASLIASNASVTIAPTGGSETRLGNNPIGFGFPIPGGDPVLLDMAISVAARGKIRAALKAGQPIPADWATDADGRPTTDPAAALKGFLQPMSGHKGYGLALAVDILAGVFSNAAYLTHVKSWVDEPECAQDLGHIFLLIDTARLGSTEWLAQRMTDVAGLLHGTPPTDADRPVLLPGEREIARLKAARAEGVEMERDVLDQIRALTA